MVKAPIAWVGGKFYLSRKIINIFPEHHAYVEVFGGAGHVLFKKDLSKVEVYNDIDNRLVNFFEVVKNPETSHILKQKLENVLYSRFLFDKCLEGLKANESEPVEKAFQFFVVNRSSFGAKMTNFGYGAKRNYASAFHNAVNRLDDVFDRLKNVLIENKGFEYIFKTYDAKDTLFYADPPYMFNENRNGCKLYKYEMERNDHQRLVDCLSNIKGKAILSGYDNDIYDHLGWHKTNIGESNMCLKKTIDSKRLKKTEYLWHNFKINN